MNRIQLIKDLRQKIDVALRPIIDSDYHLLEVPHYSNVGDSLIWQGELDFLSSIPHNRKSMHASDTFTGKGIKEGDVILFQGGGNFGDIWTVNHEFKMSVVRAFPRNKIIFLPQSVWFNDPGKLKQCAQSLSVHRDITICARDTRSYEILESNFKNRILLVPDMAFYMDIARWKPATSGDKDIVLLRDDVERKDSAMLHRIIERGCTITSDWPTMANGWTAGFYMNVLQYSPISSRRIKDLYANWIYRPAVIKSGVNFIAKAKHVHSTRLHGAILSILIGRPVTIYDNSYGKNQHFYSTWLRDCESVDFQG